MPRRTNPNPLGQAIGLRIKQLRGEQGITAEKLAYESEVGSKGFLSDIEHGLALPSLLTLERIAQRLEVSLFDLLVFPNRSDRDRLVDRTRHVSKGSLSRILRETTDAARAVTVRAAPKMQALRGYLSLEVAAGWSTQALPRGEPISESLRLPGKFNRRRDFAVRASGSSMQGFRSTIRDGDWLILQRAQVSPDDALGQVVLILRADEYGDKSLHIKRIARSGRRIWFRSDDGDTPPMAATESDRVLATLSRVITPESIAPEPLTQFARSRIASVFGISSAPNGPWVRIDGHLFFSIKSSELKQRAGLVMPGCVPRPAETAYLLLVEGDSVEYRGLLHFDAARGTWQLAGACTSK